MRTCKFLEEREPIRFSHSNDGFQAVSGGIGVGPELGGNVDVLAARTPGPWRSEEPSVKQKNEIWIPDSSGTDRGRSGGIQ